MGSREIKVLTRSVGGKVHLPEQAGLIRTESTLESDFALSHARPGGAHVQSQPLTIEFVDSGGKTRRYTPDFLVVHPPTVDGRQPSPQLVETKYRSELDRNAAKYAEKFRAAERYALDRGWQFVVQTEEDVRGPELNNLKFLMLYARSPLPDSLIWDRVQISVRRLGEATVREVLADLDPDPAVQMRLLPHLWQQVLHRTLQVDLSLPLNMRTRLGYLPELFGETP